MKTNSSCTLNYSAGSIIYKVTAVNKVYCFPVLLTKMSNTNSHAPLFIFFSGGNKTNSSISTV